MSDPIDFAPLQPAPAVTSEPGELERLTDVTVEVSVEIGRTTMTLGEALALGPGSVVGLHRMAGHDVRFAGPADHDTPSRAATGSSTQAMGAAPTQSTTNPPGRKAVPLVEPAARRASRGNARET